jgi:hypothetical protein
MALVACTRETATDPPDARVFPGSASLTWTQVKLNTDGSPVNGLAGYIIRYRNVAARGWQVLRVQNPNQTTYVVTNLYPGTWNFAVSAYTRDGNEGLGSNIVSKRVN